MEQGGKRTLMEMSELRGLFVNESRRGRSPIKASASGK